MKTLKLENTQDFLGLDKIIVNKNDFEVYTHDLGNEPYYSISLKNSFGGNNVYAGDPGWDDSYDFELIQSLFNDWDGELFYEQNSYKINF